MLILSDSPTKSCVIFAAALLITSPAHANADLDNLVMAQSLATVLTAEEFCGLTYDQTAITKWITDNVAPDNMGFASTLSTASMGAKFTQDSMAGSAKTAHCAAITQTAKHYGFVKE